MTLSLDDIPPEVLPAIRFPLELKVPEDFHPDRLETWPDVPGRLEYVDGRLLYMPPCGEAQGLVVLQTARVLANWNDTAPDFQAATNEIGVALGHDRRSADAAVWSAPAQTVTSTGFLRTPPVLAVEVAGQDEDERDLRRKARWYLDHGVDVVWLILPESREVVVITLDGESRHGPGQRLPPHPALPGLEPEVDCFFRRLR